MALIDPLALLERPDKWYLGNAGMLLYAPPFPQHLDVPGFWDECHFGALAVPRWGGRAALPAMDYQRQAWNPVSRGR